MPANNPLRFEVEEVEAIGPNLFNVIIANRDVSISGKFGYESGKFVGAWSAHPRKFKNKQVKREAELFLTLEDLPKIAGVA